MFCHVRVTSRCLQQNARYNRKVLVVSGKQWAEIPVETVPTVSAVKQNLASKTRLCYCSRVRTEG
jgi:hypothetical protein